MQDTHALATLGFRPSRVFDGFPYLVTRVVPAMYHIIVLPDDAGADDLIEIARCQRRANVLPTCLVLASNSVLYIAPDGREDRGEAPTGGIIVTNRLRPCRAFPETSSLVARRSTLEQFIEQIPTTGYVLGDLTKGGRPATLEERVMLAGTQPNGVPRGLIHCRRCDKWHGRCLDPGPRFAGQVMEVHCRCANDSRCAACGDRLYTRKLNANEYNQVDGQIWHTPGFSGFAHVCRAGVATMLQSGRPS